MPRDSNGNYTLPSGNPVIPGTVIEAAWANPTMADIGSALTDSLDRYGRGAMQAPFKFLGGGQASPGIAWADEPSTGFYREGQQDMRAVVNGQWRQRWTSLGVDIYKAAAWSPISTDADLAAHVAAANPHVVYALAATVPPNSRTINTTNSLTGGGDLSANRTLQLVGDVASPGTTFYYGTNDRGDKGWYSFSGVVGVPEAPIDGNSYARKDASWVSLGAGGSQYVLKAGDTMTGPLVLPGTPSGAQAAQFQQITSGIAAHAAAADPHPVYALKTGTTFSGLVRIGSGGEYLEETQGNQFGIQGKGAVWKWNPTNLPRGSISISTTDPTTDDLSRAGEIVLVYE